MGLVKDILTGSDNETIAIGRLLGVVVAAVLVIALPIIAVATIVYRMVAVEIWAKLFDALGIYVPLVVAAIAGLIWGTSPTEPKPRPRDNHEEDHV